MSFGHHRLDRERMTAGWPKQGRCGACLHRAEQYPSGRWRHLTRPCGPRSTWLWRPGGLPLPKAEFVADTDPLPQPDQSKFHPVLEYDDGDGVPARIGFHSPRQVADYWARVRAHLHAETEEGK